MSAEDNKAVVRRWIETFNNPYTPQTEVDALAPGYSAHAPGLPGPLDLEGWSQFTASFVEAFPDLRLTVEDIFSSEDMVAARVSFRGTHRGEFQGIPPTGKEVAFSSIEIDRMVDGKVAEHWFEMDLLGLMGQLGAPPSQNTPRKPTPPNQRLRVSQRRECRGRGYRASALLLALFTGVRGIGILRTSH